ncbi:hypothetical protein LCGC14_0809500 [marine sediment metagenome]|uniref:Uncharacterized protein n=1 Tax=marine sediment metagenome TaxID=412755 RepID=A0A0F9PM67_9ZZZZ|nr:hypothetical protein [Candidatus Aminicenantes bacterium]
MKPTTITAIVLVTFGVFSILRSGQAKPDQVPALDAPSAELQVIVKPITEVLNGYPKQASVLSSFYLEASKTIRRDGRNAKIIRSKNHLRTFGDRAVTLRFQEIFQKVPGLSKAIHGKSGALSQVLGLDPGPLDHEKTADAFYAVAWACQEAK